MVVKARTACIEPPTVDLGPLRVGLIVEVVLVDQVTLAAIDEEEGIDIALLGVTLRWADQRAQVVIGPEGVGCGGAYSRAVGCSR